MDTSTSSAYFDQQSRHPSFNHQQQQQHHHHHHQPQPQPHYQHHQSQPHQQLHNEYLYAASPYHGPGPYEAYAAPSPSSSLYAPYAPSCSSYGAHPTPTPQPPPQPFHQYHQSPYGGHGYGVSSNGSVSLTGHSLYPFGSVAAVDNNGCYVIPYQTRPSNYSGVFDNAYTGRLVTIGGGGNYLGGRCRYTPYPPPPPSHLQTSMVSAYLHPSQFAPMPQHGPPSSVIHYLPQRPPAQSSVPYSLGEENYQRGSSSYHNPVAAPTPASVRVTSQTSLVDQQSQVHAEMEAPMHGHGAASDTARQAAYSAPLVANTDTTARQADYSTAPLVNTATTLAAGVSDATPAAAQYVPTPSPMPTTQATRSPEKQVTCQEQPEEQDQEAFLSIAVEERHKGSSASNDDCMTTLLPLVSASGTDSGLSSGSVPARSDESPHSTPVYVSNSSDYSMSDGSFSGYQDANAEDDVDDDDGTSGYEDTSSGRELCDNELEEEANELDVMPDEEEPHHEASNENGAGVMHSLALTLRQMQPVSREPLNASELKDIAGATSQDNMIVLLAQKPAALSDGNEEVCQAPLNTETTIDAKDEQLQIQQNDHKWSSIGTNSAKNNENINIIIDYNYDNNMTNWNANTVDESNSGNSNMKSSISGTTTTMTTSENSLSMATRTTNSDSGNELSTLGATRNNLHFELSASRAKRPRTTVKTTSSTTTTTTATTTATKTTTSTTKTTKSKATPQFSTSAKNNQPEQQQQQQQQNNHQASTSSACNDWASDPWRPFPTLSPHDWLRPYSPKYRMSNSKRPVVVPPPPHNSPVEYAPEIGLTNSVTQPTTTTTTTYQDDMGSPIIGGVKRKRKLTAPAQQHAQQMPNNFINNNNNNNNNNNFHEAGSRMDRKFTNGVPTEMRGNLPLPGFRQTFGSTDIGSFSKNFQHIIDAALNTERTNEEPPPYNAQQHQLNQQPIMDRTKNDAATMHRLLNGMHIDNIPDGTDDYNWFRSHTASANSSPCRSHTY